MNKTEAWDLIIDAFWHHPQYDLHMQEVVRPYYVIASRMMMDLHEWQQQH